MWQRLDHTQYPLKSQTGSKYKQSERKGEGIERSFVDVLITCTFMDRRIQKGSKVRLLRSFLE